MERQPGLTDFGIGQSTLQLLKRPATDERIDWTKICLNPRTKKGMSLTAYFALYLTNGFTPEEIKDNLIWELKKQGKEWTWEHQRRFDIAMTARPGERKTYMKPVKRKFARLVGI